MPQTNIECEHCKSSVVPRLYHLGGSIFTYVLTQHLCPICGSVMYESGGEIRTQCKVIVLFVLFLYCIVTLLDGAFSQFIWLFIAFLFVSILAFPRMSGKVARNIKHLIIK